MVSRLFEESALQPPDHRVQRSVLYFLSYLTDFLSAVLVFTLSRQLAESGTEPLRLGVFGVCWSLAYAVSAAAFGHLSDRLGRRRLIFGGGVAFAVAYGLAFHSTAAPLVFVEGVLGGIATALVFPPLIALLSLSDGQPQAAGRQQTRTLILFCLSWNLGVISGNAAGGWLFAISARTALSLGLGLAAVHMLTNIAMAARTWLGGLVAAPTWPRPAAAATGAREAASALGPGASAGTVVDDPLVALAAAHQPGERRVHAAEQRFYAVVGWLANITGCVAMSLITYVLPGMMTQLGISSPVHGMLVMSGRVMIVGMYLLLHFTRFWRYRLLPALLTQAVAMVGLVVLSQAVAVPWLTVGVVLLGVMMGYSYFSSIFYSTTGFSQRRRGLASGIHEATLALGNTTGSLGGGYLASVLGMRAPFQWSIGVLAVSAVVQLAGFAAFRRRMGSLGPATPPPAATPTLPAARPPALPAAPPAPPATPPPAA